MQVLLNNSTYTELNTVPDSFMIQNTSGSDILVTAAVTPEPTETGFILKAGAWITDKDYSGIFSGKSVQDTGSCEVVV